MRLSEGSPPSVVPAEALSQPWVDLRADHVRADGSRFFFFPEGGRQLERGYITPLLDHEVRSEPSGLPSPWEGFGPRQVSSATGWDDHFGIVGPSWRARSAGGRDFIDREIGEGPSKTRRSGQSHLPFFGVAA